MHRKRILWLFALATAVVISGALWFIAATQQQQSVTLSDDTRIALCAVTVSRHPRFCFGNPFQQLLEHVPAKLHAMLGGSSVLDLGDQGQTVLTLWFSCDTTNSSSPHRITLRDSKDRPWLNVAYPRPYGNGRNFSVVAREWPRRDKTVKVDLSAKYDTIASRIVVVNPSYGRHPQLKPESLPATRRVGNLEFTLQAADIHTHPDPKNVDYYFRGVSVLTKVTERGQPTTDWEPSSLALADATGNSAEHLRRCSDACFEWPAMHGEDAVKLRVEFVKKNGSGSNELFLVRGVPMLPLPPWRFTTNLPVGRLVLTKYKNVLDVVPPGYDSANSNWSSRRFILHSITDARGYKASVEDSGTRAHFIPGAKTMDITLAVPAVQWAEWVIPADAESPRRTVTHY